MPELTPDVLRALDLKADTAVVVLRGLSPEAFDAQVESFEALAEAIRTVAPNAVLLAVDDGMTLEMLSESEMAAAGWVRANKGGS